MVICTVFYTALNGKTGKLPYFRFTDQSLKTWTILIPSAEIFFI
jgi:hypothetical protein